MPRPPNPPGHDHDDDDNGQFATVMARLRVIRDMLLGSIPSLITDIDAKQDTQSATLAEIQTELAEIKAIVLDIQAAIGSPAPDVNITFGPPTPK